MKDKTLNVIFCGTPDFSLPSLEILFNHPQVNVLAVISQLDKKVGRGHKLKSPPVIEFAQQQKMTYFQTENINHDKDILEFLSQHSIDCFIVLAFAQFLGNNILNTPSLGCFNIHTSLLPKYRGAAPIQYALINGDTETGVSIQKMVKQMDAGPICFERKVSIARNETGGQLYTRLKFEAGLALNQFIQNLLDDSLQFRDQNEKDVSFAPTLKREDGHLQFHLHSSRKIYDLIRALYPWPGTYCFLNQKRLKIISASKSDMKLRPGEIHLKRGKLIVGCQNGSIELIRVQLEGKKPCMALELINGLKIDPQIS